MFRFRYIVGFLLFVLFVIIGCKNYKIPKGFPKPDKMADMLTEILILENTMQYGCENQISSKDSYGYYRSALEKYGYTYEQFDSIRKWYVSNTELYQKVYDKVIINLSKRETELGLLLDKEKEELKNLSDSLLLAEKDKSELWLLADSIVVSPSDTIDKRIPFDIDVDTLDLSGMLRLSAQYKFLNNDESKNPQMMLKATYSDTTLNILYEDIPHSFQKKTAILDLFLDENKTVTKIDGYLLWQDSLLNSSVEITDIRLKIIRDTVNTDIYKEIEEKPMYDKDRNRTKYIKLQSESKPEKEVASP